MTLLPRVLAGEVITRQDLAELAHGGLCLDCAECHFPICPFGSSDRLLSRSLDGAHGHEVEEAGGIVQTDKLHCLAVVEGSNAAAAQPQGRGY